ncbi:aldo/keto reductase [Jatrophihabitans sp. DSM 45814]
MELRTLGRSGVRVTSLCLGTMTFGNEADEATSKQIIDRYLAAGGNFVDTADVYSRGASEEIVGRALKSRRDGIVLATKGRMPMSDDPNDRGASRRHLTRAVEASLRRLQTDRIDLYQIHWPDTTVAPEETLSALDDLVRSGKVLSVGVSNYLGSQLATAIALCDRYGWSPVVSLQPQFSLISREIELEILPLCRREGLAVLPWSPLGGGVLTGKYRAGNAPDAQTRLGDSEAQARRRLTERNMAIADEVARIGASTNHSSAQVALNWVLHHPGVTSPILGARTIDQLEDNLGAEGWQLDIADIEALEKVSRVPRSYPHDMYRVLGIEI